MAARITAAQVNCDCWSASILNPKNSKKLRGGNTDGVSFGLWEKKNPWPLTPLITKTSPNKNNSHVGSLRATQQETVVTSLNTLSSRQNTLPVIEVLLEDNNALIWNEFREICEEFNSSNKPRSTSKLLLEMMQFLLRHNKSSIYRTVGLLRDYHPLNKNTWLRTCFAAEYGAYVTRMMGKLWRLLKWGRNSSTVLIRLTTHINNDDVSMEEFRNCLAEREDGDVDKLFSEICKGHKIAMHFSNSICFQPRVFLYASAKQDFGESPPDFVFEAVSSRTSDSVDETV